MIHYYKRNEIAIAKYNTCIKNSINSSIYAYSWYLDIVADNWDVLVLNDYEAVMPLPWRSKFFIKYIYPPPWTQQLGVFSKREISEGLIQRFINFIPNKFKKITIQLNSGNGMSFLKPKKRINYILPLNNTYKDLHNKYKNNRKQSINTGKKNKLIIKNCLFSELEIIAKENYSHLKISDRNYKKLKLLTEYIQKNDKGFLLGVYNTQDKLVGGAIFLKDDKRISYLFSVVTLEGKQLQANSFLIDKLLKKYANSNYIFDFEGSMILGVANFFRSFGAVKETYFLYERPFHLLKKM